MAWNDVYADFGSLSGKILRSIEGATKGSGEIIFTLDDGQQFKMYHSQDCCESVEVEDICGAVSDLLGAPIVLAECVSNAPKPTNTEQEDGESNEWTFYKLATNKGAVTIRWYGTSNGYYSTGVDFVKNPTPAAKRANR